MTSEPEKSLLKPLSIAQYQSLLETAERFMPRTDATGVTAAWKVDARGASIYAVYRVRDWQGFVVATVEFDGQWEVGGGITWTPRAR